MTAEGASDVPDLDTVTALRLGDALWRFLARQNQESDLDDFTWEDSGIAWAGFWLGLGIWFGLDELAKAL